MLVPKISATPTKSLQYFSSRQTTDHVSIVLIEFLRQHRPKPEDKSSSDKNYRSLPQKIIMQITLQPPGKMIHDNRGINKN